LPSDLVKKATRLAKKEGKDYQGLDEIAQLGYVGRTVKDLDKNGMITQVEVMKAGITMRIGKGYMGEASDIAEMVRFLVGPESRYCTGDVFTVSGGYR
jgi:NAD(P)-dependent dehydrogenase (short-subunit alcohol dehydrogenase family)